MTPFTLIGCISLIFACVITAAAPAADPKPTTAPSGVPGDPAAAGAAGDIVTTKVRVQTFKPTTYLYKSSQATLNTIGKIADATMPALESAMKTGGIQPQGAPVFVYHNPTMQMDQPFTLDIGFPVPDDAKAPQGYQVGKLQPLRAATVLYSGPIARIGEAYTKAFTEVFANTLQPAAENREYYLCWEGAESPSNVVMIQIGVK